MSVMAFELAASRLYAPYFGSSIYVWAGLIGALLFFLAIGSFAGDRMCRAGAGAPRLYQLALAASLFGAAAPYTALPVMRAASDAMPLGGNMIPGILAASLCSLAVPLVLLGCMVPLAIGALTSDAKDAGQVAGLLNAISTAGCIAGIFVATLVTLPYLGTRATFLAFALVTACVAVAGLATSRAIPALVLFLPFLLLNKAVPIRPAPDGHVRLVEVETPYNYVQITEKDDYVLMLVNQGWISYSKYRKGTLRTGSYRDYFPMSKLLSDDEQFPRSICILGLAGGTDARLLRKAFPGARITGVEIDPVLLELGKEFMGLGGAGEIVDRMVVADGRAFLNATDEKFDLIVVDVYNQAYIPFHLATVEFFSLARARLNPGGVVAMNVAWRSADSWELPERCAATLKEVFPVVYVQMFKRKANTLLYATTAEPDPRHVALRLISTKNPYLHSLIADGIAVFSPYENPGLPFTDDLAPVELYTRNAIRDFFASRVSKSI